MADDVDLWSTASAIRYVPNMQPKAPNDRSTVSEFVDTVLAWQDPYSVGTLGTSFHVW
jgi:deoxyxylulose-5-phosphate synthase